MAAGRSRGGSAGFAAYVSDFARFDRKGFAVAVLLTVLSAFTESFGLLLLVPLVVAAGVVDGGESGLTDGVASALDSIGIPFTLGWMLVVYVVLVSIGAAVGWARAVVTARLQYAFVDSLRLRLFDAVARADWRFHLDRRRSDISHVVTSDVSRVQSGTSVALDLFARAVTTVGYLIVAFRLSAPTSALALGLLLGIVAVLWPTVRRSRRLGTKQTRFGRQAFAAQSDFLEALKLAKSHGNEDRHVEAYADRVRELRASMVDHQRLTARSNALMQAGIAASVAVLAWVAVTRFDTPGPELLALIAVISRLAPTASTGLNRAQLVANMLPAYANANELLADALDAVEEDPAVPAEDEAAPFEEAVELHAVSFSYVADRPTLESIDLRIAAGTTVALVGPSGAGKTTIGDVVLGLLEPSSGAVRIDGVDLREMGQAAWRKQVAYVPQESYLFHDTLRENILWAAHEDLSDADIEQLVDAAALGPVVAALTEGLDTVVGDRGHRLSGGERQRVALARALARRPALLVLDEATSALDDANERSVQEAIDGLHGSVAMLVIAHRLSTIRNADEIIVLDAGRVVERGTWDELARAGGRFATFPERADT